MNESIKILIVDDEPIGRQLLEAILMPENYELLFAEDGGKAYNKTLEYLPDIILLDVMMPVMDGYEVCRKIRQNHDTAHITIFLITALDDRDSRIKGIDAGADDYISKPFDRVEILAKIKNRLSLIKFRHKERTGQITEISVNNSAVKEYLLLKGLINELLSHPFTTTNKYIDIFHSEDIDKSRCAFIELPINDGSYFIGLSNNISGPDAAIANCIVASIFLKYLFRADLSPTMLIRIALEEIHNSSAEKSMPLLINAGFSFLIVYVNSKHDNFRISGLNQTIFISSESANLALTNQNKTYQPYYLMGNQDLQFSSIREIVFFSNNLLESFSQPEILSFLNNNLVSDTLKTLSSIVPEKFNQIDDILVVKLGFLND
jgi:CheY-like chemotaxis protein